MSEDTDWWFIKGHFGCGHGHKRWMLTVKNPFESRTFKAWCEECFKGHSFILEDEKWGWKPQPRRVKTRHSYQWISKPAGSWPCGICDEADCQEHRLKMAMS